MTTIRRCSHQPGQAVTCAKCIQRALGEMRRERANDPPPKGVVVSDRKFSEIGRADFRRATPESHE